MDITQRAGTILNQDGISQHIKDRIETGLRNGNLEAILAVDESLYDLFIEGEQFNPSENLGRMISGRSRVTTPNPEEKIRELGLELIKKRRALEAEQAKRHDVKSKFMQMQIELGRVLTTHQDLQRKVADLTYAMASAENSHDIVAAIKNNFPATDARLPQWLNFAINLAHKSWLPDFVIAQGAKQAVAVMGMRYIGGDHPQTSKKTGLKLAASQQGMILDELGTEGPSDPLLAQRYVDRYLNFIDELTKSPHDVAALRKAKTDRRENLTVEKFAEKFEVDAQLAIKFSGMSVSWKSRDQEKIKNEVKVGLRAVLDQIQEAQVKGVKLSLTVDPEELWNRDLVIQILTEVLSEDKYKRMENVGIAVQAYFRDSMQILKRLEDFSAKRGYSMPIRLVKGAYHKHEVAEALKEGRKIPVFALLDAQGNIAAESMKYTNFHYEEAARYLMNRCPNLRAHFGAHNLRSVSAVVTTARNNTKPIGWQMLFGLEPYGAGSVTTAGVPLDFYMPAVDAQGTEAQIKRYVGLQSADGGIEYLTRRMVETSTPGAYVVMMGDPSVTDDMLIAPPIDNADDLQGYLDQADRPPDFFLEPHMENLLATEENSGYEIVDEELYADIQFPMLTQTPASISIPLFAR